MADRLTNDPGEIWYGNGWEMKFSIKLVTLVGKWLGDEIQHKVSYIGFNKFIQGDPKYLILF